MDAVIKALNATRDETDGTAVSRADAEGAIRTLLAHMGEDPTREGLIDTPARLARAHEEMFAGYRQDATEELSRTFEEVSGYDDMIILRDVAFFSHCEHHILPIRGKAHIAYYPTDRVVGLSKLARVVDIFARRLQTQENLTAQIAAAIDSVLAPRGVAVMVEAEHMCMAMRGIRQAGTSTVTSRYVGCFKDDREEQARFLQHVRYR